ncbi:MAG: tetratricopeptide repeat protein, partial [Gammaproteobacteria bacterium]
RPWTAEIVGTLERALELDPNHPLANHLYIHAMEASPHPEKALPSARRLPALVPGSGHLVHMPAHIYLRIGRYRDAALANEAAIAIDHDYLGHAHEESIYTRAYVPHNFHFLWAAAVKSGQSKLALQAAQDTAHKVDPKLLRDPAYSATLQHFSVIPLYTLVLFGKWPEILRQAEPAEDLLYAQGIWHYARGLALTRLGKTSKARRELRRLEEIRRDPAIGALKIFDVNPVEQILRIAEATLAGEIAAARKNYPEAVTHLQKAIEIEDSLNYTEPKDWYLPSRQVLGAILLESGDPLKAEKVFAEDLKIHPQNGWSLFGLAQSLNALGKNDQARKIGQDFEKAWQDADIQLKSARF